MMRQAVDVRQPVLDIKIKVFYNGKRCVREGLDYDRTIMGRQNRFPE